MDRGAASTSKLANLAKFGRKTYATKLPAGGFGEAARKVAKIARFAGGRFGNLAQRNNVTTLQRNNGAQWGRAATDSRRVCAPGFTAEARRTQRSQRGICIGYGFMWGVCMRLC
jgi:hypothetical protein